MENTFNDPVFKLLFNLDQSESICRSSISERLSKIDSDFFKQIYECIYEQFSELYSETDKLKYNLIRVDSYQVMFSILSYPDIYLPYGSLFMNQTIIVEIAKHNKLVIGILIIG